MREIDVSKSGIISKPWPLPEAKWEWIGKPECELIARIKVDYGNFIENEYVDRGTIWNYHGTGLAYARRIDGKMVMINPAKIVEVEEFTLARCRYLINGIKECEYLVLVDDEVDVIYKDRKE